MNTQMILTAFLTVGIIGLICGILLSILSEVFKVPTDEKADHIESEILPGANCGSCGYSGCSGYAAALSSGKTTNTALCNPGGQEVSQKIAEYLGLSAGSVERKSAVVLCDGSCDKAETKMEYEGLKSCSAASALQGGEKMCSYGCLGYGDCINVCEYGAIKLCDGVARIDPRYCKACSKCVNVCPRGLIELFPVYKKKAGVMCKNKDKGAQARKECSAACIGCMKCQKVCETGAVTVVNFNAHVDTNKCTGCGKCVENCPVKCIEMIDYSFVG